MNDTENTLEENVLQCGDEAKKLSCGIYLELSKGNELEFNVIWDDDEDIVKLATLINAVINTNLIMSQIEQMDTDSPESIEVLKKYINALSSKPVISPLEVCHNANKND